MRAVRTGVAVGLVLGGEESAGGALLYDASLRGEAGLDGLFGFLGESGDRKLGGPTDAVDFLFNVGLRACMLGDGSGKSFAWKNFAESGLQDSKELDLVGSGEAVALPLPT